MRPVIEAHNLSKRYRLGTTALKFDRLTEYLTGGLRNRWQARRHDHGDGNAQQWIWGLDRVNFEVEAGEIVGVLGSNGAGKSTLLKILSRITDPTSGYVWLRGRASSLLEVGTGFHPDLTGRENIFLNGSILGMRKAEVDSKLDEIVAFSEIGSFLDTPVKRYSSGMFVRLAFAVAAHLDPEILIIDEVLAVGDMAFQKKCLGKMGDASKSGRTVLFVSHNVAMVQNLCRRGIVLRTGKLVYDGRAEEAIDFYVHSVFGGGCEKGNDVVDLDSHANRAPKFKAPLLRRIGFDNGEGIPVKSVLPYGSSLRVKIACLMEEPLHHADVLLSFNTMLGQPVFVANSGFEPGCVTEELSGDQTFVCDIPCMSLVPGEYMLNVALAVRENMVDCVKDCTRITIVPSDFYGTGRMPRHGNSVLTHHWSMHAGNDMPDSHS